jgi:hypothetical protein
MHREERESLSCVAAEEGNHTINFVAKLIGVFKLRYE